MCDLDISKQFYHTGLAPYNIMTLFFHCDTSVHAGCLDQCGQIDFPITVKTMEVSACMVGKIISVMLCVMRETVYLMHDYTI